MVDTVDTSPGNGQAAPEAPVAPWGNGGPPTVMVTPRWRRSQRVRDRVAVSRPTVSVVIPTLNEEKNLPHVFERLPDIVTEVIIVDGRSTDATVEIATELLPDCVVVREERPGKGIALRSGFAAATGDIIVMLDADGSTDPREIPSFVGTLVAGADFVKGSRFMQGGGTDDMEAHRKAGNWALTSLVNLAFGGRFSDLCYGYNAFWRDILPNLGLDSDGFEIETLMGIRALRAGLEVAEVPSFECSRIHGVSNLVALRDGFRILRTIVLERLRPFRAGTERVAPALGRSDAGALRGWLSTLSFWR